MSTRFSKGLLNSIIIWEESHDNILTSSLDTILSIDEKEESSNENVSSEPKPKQNKEIFIHDSL